MASPSQCDMAARTGAVTGTPGQSSLNSAVAVDSGRATGPFPYRRAIRWCSHPRRKASLVNSAGVVHEQIDPGPSGGTENLVRLHVS